VGWFGGEWVDGSCEDAPCCGCCGVETGEGEWFDHQREEWDSYDFDDEDEWDEESDGAESDYWQAEDAGLEYSLFGDC
jgi:hypothetical protein